jgi:hypothetical protein
MKTTMFGGEHMSMRSYDQYDRVTILSVPTLSAYAVEFGEFTPPADLDVGYRALYLSSDFTITEDVLLFHSPFSVKFSGLERCRLAIHYHGIRDFARLFPQVSETALRDRLGQFYEEADITFDRGAWLSFALMAAAVYEGLLGWRLGDPKGNFSDLIKRGVKDGIITELESRILEDARASRNLVHAGRFVEPSVTRLRAMNMRTVLDSLIRKFANAPDKPLPPIASSTTSAVSG